MIRRLRGDEGGATAVEFALISPIFLGIVLGTMALGLGFWMKNTLQEIATETARCVAIGASACTAAAPECGTVLPGICYYQKIAAKRGISGIQASHVDIDRTATHGEVSFTTVTVTYPVDLLGYNYSITASGHFPNAI